MFQPIKVNGLACRFCQHLGMHLHDETEFFYWVMCDKCKRLDNIAKKDVSDISLTEEDYPGLSTGYMTDAQGIEGFSEA
jgi:hypothetical protein